MKSIFCEVFDSGSGDSSQRVAEHVNNLLGMLFLNSSLDWVVTTETENGTELVLRAKVVEGKKNSYNSTKEG